MNAFVTPVPALATPTPAILHSVISRAAQRAAAPKSSHDISRQFFGRPVFNARTFAAPPARTFQVQCESPSADGSAPSWDSAKQVPIDPNMAVAAAMSHPSSPERHSPILDWIYSNKYGWLVAGLVIGFLAGCGGGLIGLGGAFVLIPIVTSLLKFTQHEGHGTALVAVIATGISGCYTYYQKGMLLPLYGLIITVTAIISARFGALAANKMDGGLLKKFLGLWWVWAAIRIGRKAVAMGAGAAAVATPVSPLATATLANAIPMMMQYWQTTGLLLITGLMTGLIVGLLGTGGAAVSIPMMVQCGIMQQMAQGTALMAMILPAITGVWTHYKQGNVRTELIPGLIPGVLVGARAGALLACGLPERTMKFVFAVMLMYLGLKMLNLKGMLVKKEAAKSDPEKKQ
eukprot:tig00001024_g6326.t1